MKTEVCRRNERIRRQTATQIHFTATKGEMYYEDEKQKGSYAFYGLRYGIFMPDFL